MRLVIETVIILGILGSILARSIPQYDLCMDLCGEDPHEDDIAEVANVDACRDKCNEEETNRCLSEHFQNNEEQQKCWMAGRQRCASRCGDDVDCILTCEFNYPPIGK
ncbi:hypothetical protein CRM22_010598 [Opisthorchis felineus]|uniref:Uncharacterized protein n=1 Tax=Opisthorchis felineus TaxID=147828 RepID=A0A4S2KRJ3_OPIFE|nr:hypothetical protein CRM22_010598 [Opisthorchis felineus]